MSRRTVLAVIGVAVLAAATVAGLRVFDRPPKAVATDAPDPVQTVAIKRTTLALTRQLSGELGYGPATPVKSRGAGTITWLPAKGTKLDRGDVVFRVDDKPVVLFYGSTPLFRPLGEPGRKAPPIDGPDVAVVKQNLAALGFLANVTTDRLTAGTISGVKAWQKSLGLTPTGLIDPTTVVVLPGAIRVDAIKAQLGDPSPAEALSVTTVQKVVTVAVPAGDSQGVRTGVAVKVGLPDGTTTTGKIAGLSDDAVKPDSTGDPAGGGQNAELTATIALGKPAATGSVDSGPVTVTVPGETKANVLAVPIAALLALREGGYAVQVANDGRTTLVGVQLGMFADGNVEITAPGLKAGMLVVTTS